MIRTKVTVLLLDRLLREETGNQGEQLYSLASGPDAEL